MKRAGGGEMEESCGAELWMYIHEYLISEGGRAERLGKSAEGLAVWLT